MYSVRDIVEETGSSKEDLNYMLDRLEGYNLYRGLDLTVQAPCEHFIPPVLLTVTEGNNTSPAAAPATAAPAAAATAAAALAALAALPDLEPDPIYNITPSSTSKRKKKKKMLLAR
ncbi:hypothetical protein BT67DRAFT_434419 [Trichocladium antarcticum]|uniref:Uncharacterized protein n=1 Tax=Trichocladium antarcticum TaxID=1450529 RepID=A0AAN6ZEB7_9PEZI|nr:hypothetical protein BT67DRAFT_434419 [Trichocladium antarcticum]